MGKLLAGIVAVVTGSAGAILTFVDPRTIVAWGLGFGRHNDRVLVGVLLLEIAFVAVYWMLTKKQEKKAVKKSKSKKSKKKK